MTRGIRQLLHQTYLSITVIILAVLAITLMVQGQRHLMDTARNATLESSQLRSQVIAFRIQQEITKLDYLSKTSTARALNGSEILSLLNNIVSDAENRLLVNAMYARPDGSITTLLNESGNISDQPYFAKLLNENLDYMISDPIPTQPNMPPLVILLVSVRDAQDTITGVLGSAIDLGKLSDSLTDASFNKSSYSWILDKNGLPIAYPNAESLKKMGFTDTSKPSFAGIDVLGKDALKENSGFLSFSDNSDGRAKLGAYATIPGTDGWKLCTAVSTRTVYSHLYLMAGVLITGSVLLVIMMTLAGNRIAQSIAKPISQVSQSAENLMNGTYVPVEESTATQELTDLANSFNQMAGILSAKTEELGKAVSDKDKFVKNITSRIHDRNDRIVQDSRQFFDASVRDNLTHLLNRNEMLKQLELIKSDVDTEITESFSLLLMGLDNFKSYVDATGTYFGDKLIQNVAKMIFKTIRSTDIASRYDNDIFMIILSGTNQVRAEAVIKKLNQSFSALLASMKSPSSQDGTDSTLTPYPIDMELSFSVVIYTKKIGLPVASLIAQAESALGEVKSEHRQVHLIDAAFNTDAHADRLDQEMESQTDNTLHQPTATVANPDSSI